VRGEAVPPDDILFSVLILSIPSRIERFLVPLYSHLLAQVSGRRDVEVLCLIDNKVMSIGTKRQALLDSARGEWIGFLDDDDAVSPDYVDLLTQAMTTHPADIVTFDQHCVVNDDEFVVHFRMGNPHQPYVPGARAARLLRPPYHMCMWRKAIAKRVRFPDSSYGEDIGWCSAMYPLVRSEAHIDAVLHHYRYSDRSSESIEFAKQ
jgi:glycosyltransferase involved in cell wall biosynthesis